MRAGLLLTFIIWIDIPETDSLWNPGVIYSEWVLSPKLPSTPRPSISPTSFYPLGFSPKNVSKKFFKRLKIFGIAYKAIHIFHLQ